MPILPRFRLILFIKMIIYFRGRGMKNKEQSPGATDSVLPRNAKEVVEVNKPIKSLATTVTQKSGNFFRAFGSGGKKRLTKVKSGISASASETARAAKVIGESVSEVGASVGRTASTIGTTLLDQNGDGQLDQEDVRIATEKASKTVKEVVSMVVSFRLVKALIAGAVVGFVLIGPLIPFMSNFKGAMLGAIIAVLFYLKKNL
jgi:hypothetical protein